MGIELSKTLIPYNETDEKSEYVNGGSALYKTAIAKMNVLRRDLCFDVCIFITVSSNPQHSGHFTRRNDLSLNQKNGNTSGWIRKVAMKDFPSLKVTAKDACKVMLPDYKVSHICRAREVLEVIDKYHMTLRLHLARFLDMRMKYSEVTRCFRLKLSNDQDKFGCNILPTSGVWGGTAAFSNSIETQITKEPHIHVCI